MTFQYFWDSVNRDDEAHDFMSANYYRLDEEEKIRHFGMTLQRNALRWLHADSHLVEWDDVKRVFLAMFGKSAIDYDLAGTAAVF